MLPILKKSSPSVSTNWGDFSYNIDKFLPKHYNIYKYNTKGKRRSAHHPKGGVAHVEVVRTSFCFFRRNQVHNNNDTQKITALLSSGRLFPK